MSNYDGDVELTVNLEPGDVKQTAEQLNKEIQEIFSKASSSNNLSDEFKKLLATMDKVNNKSEKLKSAISQLETTPQATSYYKELTKDLDKLINKRAQLNAKQEKFDTLDVDKDSMSYKSLLYDLQKVEEEINIVKEDLKDAHKNNDDFISGSETPEYTKLITQLNEANNQMTLLKQKADSLNNVSPSITFSGLVDGIKSALSTIKSASSSIISTLSNINSKLIQIGMTAVSTLGNGVKRAFQGIGSLASMEFSALSSATKTAIGSINKLRKSLVGLFNSKIKSTFSKIKESLSGIGKSTGESNKGISLGFKTFLRYGLGIRSVFVLVNKLRSALFDGFKNLAKVDDSFNKALSDIISSLNWIKNSFAAAFAPLVEAVAPVVTKLANKLVGLIRMAGQFIAAITGGQVRVAEYVFTDYADSLDSSSSSTKKLNEESKKLKKTLAGFDDVQILNEDDEEEEEAPTYSFVPGQVDQGMSDLAEKIKDYLKGIFKVIQQAWNDSGAKMIAALKSALRSIKDLIFTIADTFYKVFTQGYGYAWLTSLFNLLGNIFKIIESIATEFKKAWVDDNRGYNYIASIFMMFTAINNTLGLIAQSFVDAWNSGSGYAIASALLRVFTNIHTLISSIAIALAIAWDKNNIGYNLIKSILDLFANILNIIGDVARDFALAFQSDKGVALISTILEYFKSIVDTINAIAESFREAWNDDNAGYDYIGSLFDLFISIFSYLTSIRNAFVEAWTDDGRGTEIIGGILELFYKINGALSTTARLFEDAWNDNGAGKTAIQAILDIIRDDLLPSLSYIAEDFENAFASTAGTDMINSIGDLLNSIIGILGTVATSFKNAWSMYGFIVVSSILVVITNINNMLASVGEAFKKAWEDDGGGDELIASIADSFISICGSIDTITNTFGNAIKSDSGVAAISEIMGALTELSNFIGTVSESFTNAWNGGDVGKQYAESINEAVGGIASSISTVTSTINSEWKSGGTGETIIQGILTLFTDINSEIGAITEGFKNAWNSSDNGKTLVGNILDVFKEMLGIIGSITTDFGKIFDESGAEQSITKILSALDSVTATLAQIELDFDEAWNDNGTGEGYIRSIKNALDEVVTAINNVFDAFTEAWKEGSKGKEIVDGIIELFTDFNESIAKVSEAFSNVWADSGIGKQSMNEILGLMNTIIENIDSISKDFGSIFSDGSGEETIERILQLLGTDIPNALNNTVAVAFKNAWNDNGLGREYIDGISEVLGEISGTLSGIITSFTSAWEEGSKGQSIVEGLLKTAKDINSTIKKFVGSFKDAWTEGNNGKIIWDNILTAADSILADIQSIAEKTKEWAGSLDLSSLVEAFKNLTESTGEFASNVSGVVKEAYEEVLLPLSEWTLEEGLPSVINLLAAAIDTINAAIEAALPGLQDLYNNILKPIATEIGDVLKGVLDDLTDALKKLGDWIKENSETVATFVEILGIFVSVFLAAKAIVAIVTGISGAFVVLMGAINPLALGFVAVAAVISYIVTHFESLRDAVINAKDAIVGFFTGNQIKESELGSSEEVLQRLTILTETLADQFGLTEEQIDKLDVALISASDTGAGTADAIDLYRNALDEAGISMDAVEMATYEACTGWETLSALMGGVIRDTADIATTTDTMTDSLTESGDAIETVGEKTKIFGDDTVQALEAFQSSMEEYGKSIGKSTSDAETSIESLGNTTESTQKAIDDAMEALKSVTNKNLDDVDEKVGSTSKTFTKFSDTTETVSSDVAKSWKDVKKSTKDELGSAAKTVDTESTNMKKSVKDSNKSVSDDAETQWKLVKSRTVKYFNQLVESVQSKSYTLSTDVQFTFKNLATKLPEKFDNVGTEIASKFNNVNELILGALNAITLDNSIYNIGKTMGQQLADGFKSIHISTPHMRISDWLANDNGNGGFIYTPKFSIDWYAKGGFPGRGELFVGNEKGVEAMGKMGNRNVVANNQQIIEGIKSGVIEALTYVLDKLQNMSLSMDFSRGSLAQFNQLNASLSGLVQLSTPLVAQGKMLPATMQHSTDQIKYELVGIKDILAYQEAGSISKDELRDLLIDIARNYISSSFYLGDEQVARHANRGNVLLNRRYGTT